MGLDREDSAAIAEAAAARVEGWIAASRADPSRASRAAAPDMLEGARSDAEGFAFARRLLEVMIDVDDPFSAALGLRAVSQDLPASLPARDRAAVRAGGLASLGLPWAVLPVARRRLRDRLSHLVLSSRLPGGQEGEQPPAKLRAALQAGTTTGVQTLLALGGETVLGPEGAAREVERLVALAGLPEVAHLAVDPARIAPPPVLGGGCWALDSDAARGAAALAPLLEAAREHGTGILLEPSDYRGALLAPAILARIIEDRAPATASLRLGARLPAELPESREAAERLILLSRRWVAAGGAPLELTVGVSGLAGRERIASLLSSLAVPTLESGEATAAQLLRLADLVLAAAADANVASGAAPVELVVETEDPVLLAAVTLLAEGRSGGVGGALNGSSVEGGGVEGGSRTAPVTAQLRAGTASVLASALAEHGFRVRERLPLVPPKEFAGAVGYLLHLAAEAASPGSPLGRAGAFAEATAEVERADDALVASRAFGEGAPLAAAVSELRGVLDLAREPFPASHRTQLRGREWHPGERDSTVFYRQPNDTERFDTGGLTAAVLGLGRDATGQIVLEADGPARRLPVVSESGFANEPDTDASRPENREWARSLLARAAEDPAAPLTAAPTDAEQEDLEAQLSAACAAAEPWRAQRATERAARVSRLALGTASARDRLIQVLAAETGGPIAVLDAEVSGAVDAARYLGQLAAGLGAVRGAEFRADRLALVVADAGVPLAERAEAVLAALAAGSAVLLVSHPSVARSSVALIEEWRAAGLPEGVLTAVAASPHGRAHAAHGAHGDEHGGEAREGARDAHAGLAAALAADLRVDRALVLGGRDTARALIRRRPSLQIEGRFRALGSTLIAPSADRAAAVRDAVRSAFGGGAADPRSARALVLLGSAARSKRLQRRLADAVRGIRVGDTGRRSGAQGGAEDPLSFDLGPLPQPPDAAGLRALTELQPGEEWLVEPERLDEAGLLWRPGVRTGLRRDAQFWSDAVGLPVIGVIAASSLDQAIALQNQLGGSVAALHASDPQETLPWLDGVRAASLVVGESTVPARVERRPGGGWGPAGMGASALAGGPNRLVALGSWRLREGTASSTLHLRGLDPEVQALVETAQSSLDYASFDRVRRAALADALAWRTSLGRVRDMIGLGVERNLLRRWPVSTHVRLAEGGSLAELVRVLAAGAVVGAPMSVSTGELLPAELSQFLAAVGIGVSLERDDAWLERIAVAGPGEGDGVEARAERVRLIGGDPVRAAEWLGGRDRVPLWAQPVTMAGPVELLAFLKEQSIAIAAHRHGFAAPLAGADDWAAALDARVRSA